MTARAAHSWLLPAISLALLGAALLAMHASLGAGFLHDDWAFLAISQHLPDPAAFYVSDDSPVNYYRPHGLLSWWLATRAFGLAAPAHHALQILLHAGTGLALLWLLRRQGHGLLVAGAGALVFVLHPATVSTASWLADRFDLMATLGLLLALAIATGPRPGRPLALAGLALAAAGAVGSKETGVLVAPLVALALLVRADLPWRLRLRVAGVAAAPVAAWAVMRLHLLGTDLGSAPGSRLSSDLATGVGHWLRWLPDALALDLGPIGAATALLAAGLAVIVGLADRNGPGRRQLALGLGLMLIPALVQWPTTILTLASEDALSQTVNLRFYHLASAGFVLLLALLASAIARRWRRDGATAAVLALVGLLALLPMAQARNAGLARVSAAPEALAVESALGAAFREQARGAGCHIHFTLPASINLPGFADHVAKAALPRGHVALDSLVLADPMPWHALVGPAGAAPEAQFPLVSRRFADGREIGPRAIGPLFTLFLAPVAGDLPPNPLCPPRRLRWDGQAFVPAA
jgi:hypothetical protein